MHDDALAGREGIDPVVADRPSEATFRFTADVTMVQREKPIPSRRRMA